MILHTACLEVFTKECVDAGGKETEYQLVAARNLLFLVRFSSILIETSIPGKIFSIGLSNLLFPVTIYCTTRNCRFLVTFSIKFETCFSW